MGSHRKLRLDLHLQLDLHHRLQLHQLCFTAISECAPTSSPTRHATSSVRVACAHCKSSDEMIEIGYVWALGSTASFTEGNTPSADQCNSGWERGVHSGTKGLPFVVKYFPTNVNNCLKLYLNNNHWISIEII